MTARLLLGRETSDHLLVVPVGRPHANATSEWDRDWIDVEVTVDAGLLHGAYRAMLTARELARFRDGLRELHTRLSGTCELDALEHQVCVHVQGDAKGHFRARCVARDEAGGGNELRFTLAFDQTELGPMLDDFDELVREYPPVTFGA